MNSPVRMTYETVAFKVPYPLFVAISELADMRGKTRSELLRDIVLFYFGEIRKDLVRQGVIDQFGDRINNKKRGRK
jgi:hypothetical protein